VKSSMERTETISLSASKHPISMVVPATTTYRVPCFYPTVAMAMI
jgi:hypothetical protein